MNTGAAIMGRMNMGTGIIIIITMDIGIVGITTGIDAEGLAGCVCTRLAISQFGRSAWLRKPQHNPIGERIRPFD
jgi:hypothetical protein